MSLNRWTGCGNLTSAPELKYTQKGTAYAWFTVAVNEVWYDAAGKKNEDTLFMDVTVWDRAAEWAAEYLHKGSEVIVEGRLKTDRWTDDNGQNRSKIKCSAEKLTPTFGTWKDSGGERERRAPSEEEETRARPTQAPGKPVPKREDTKPTTPDLGTNRAEQKTQPTAPRKEPTDADLDEPEDDIPF